MSLVTLDLLPPGCSLHADVQGLVVRFRAAGPVRALQVNADGTSQVEAPLGEWTGWFPLCACPVQLEWRLLWPEGAAPGV